MKGRSKARPSTGLGTKERKRQARREKLANELNAKREAQRLAKEEEQIPDGPVTMGKEFDEILKQIENTTVTETVRTARIGPAALQRQAIDQMRAVYNDPEFARNPRAAFGLTERVLDQKAFEYSARKEQQK